MRCDQLFICIDGSVSRSRKRKESCIQASGLRRCSRSCFKSTAALFVPTTYATSLLSPNASEEQQLQPANIRMDRRAASTSQVNAVSSHLHLKIHPAGKLQYAFFGMCEPYLQFDNKRAAVGLKGVE